MFHHFYNDVLGIEAIGNYCFFDTEDERLSLRISLTKLLKEVIKGHFMQTHRRYAIAVDRIEQVNQVQEEISTGSRTYPIGAKYKKAVMSWLKQQNKRKE